MNKEVFKKYIEVVSLNHKSMSPDTFNSWMFDYTIEFCEENDLCGLFIDCKLNPSAFYAFAKYKANNESVEKLEKYLIAGNCILDATDPRPTPEIDTRLTPENTPILGGKK